MEIIKLVLIGVAGVIIFVYLKSVNSELSTLSLVATGVILTLTFINYVIDAVKLFANLSSNLNISSQIFNIVLKIIIISYTVEFTENLCTDLGASGIGAKVSLIGKIIILVTSAPVFTTLIETITSFIK